MSAWRNCLKVKDLTAFFFELENKVKLTTCKHLEVESIVSKNSRISDSILNIPQSSAAMVRIKHDQLPVPDYYYV